MFPMILLSLIILPILEIIVFIQVGHAIGWLNAASLVLIFCFIGWTLLKLHLLNRPANFSALTQKGFMIHEAFCDQFLKWGALFLLIFPGFVSEVGGILLLIPFVRHLLILSTRLSFVQKMLCLKMPGSNYVYNEFEYQQMAERFRQNFSTSENEDDPNDENDQGDYSDHYGGRTVEFPEYPSANRTSSSREEDDDIIDVEYEIKTPQSRGN
ncbi:MAG: FxsA family protein [Planctomycetia bacterium]|nr:FxsA family protein [Planctomycetia bacterium]